MRILKEIIIREQESGNTSPDYSKLPYERAANTLMSARGYVAYVAKHGYHFTEALAELVSKTMVNRNGDNHCWSAREVETAVTALDWRIPENVTLGDLTYAANMYYSDLYPEVLTSESACIIAAYDTATDVDGYDGLIFCRWTADAIGKALDIDWEEVI